MDKLYDIYAIYTGMGGGFGGASFDKIVEYKNYYEAWDEAREMAIDLYKSYEGLHGILSEEDCEQEGVSYEDEIDNWTSFFIVEITSENIDTILEEDRLSKSDIELLKKYNFNYGDDTNENKKVNV